MCFLPNRRASIDQAPGPIIARAEAKTASARKIHGSPECDQNRAIAIQTLTTAASAPAMGVKKPIKRAIPVAMQITATTIALQGAPWPIASIPKRMSAAPVSKRRSRRPTPGQPSAKFEKSRCTASRSNDTGVAAESIVPELGRRDAPLGGLTSPGCCL